VQIPGSGDRLVTLSIKANGQVDVNVMRVGHGSIFGEQPSYYIASSQMMEYFGVRENLELPDIPTKTHMRFVHDDEEITSFIFDKTSEIPNMDHKHLRDWIDERIEAQLG
jgi:hypothetical protein